MPAPSSTRSRRWPRRLAIGLGAAVVLAIAIPFGYIHFVEGKAPPKLALPTTGTADAASTQTSSGTVTGPWSVTTGSLVGYRVNESLVGQSNTAVGRTSAVSGTFDISGTTVGKASFVAQMASVKSDQSQRDNQFDGRIMDVAKYPTATFELTKPIALGSIPALGAVHSYPATGNLTLRGQTHPVTFTISAERTAAGLELQGDIPVLFSTWDVPNPSFGSFVTTANHGTLEFLLKLDHGTQAASATTTTPATTATSAPGASSGGGFGGGGEGGTRPAGAGGGGGITSSGTTTPPLTISGG